MNDSKMHFNLLFVMDIAANTMKVSGTLSRLIIYDKITHFYRWQNWCYSVGIFHTKLMPQRRKESVAIYTTKGKLNV